MRRLAMVGVILVLLLGAAVPGFAQEDEPGTIAEVITAAADEGQFTILLAAVQAADPSVLEKLSDTEADITVFAPTDDAFNTVGEDELNAILENQELLTSILLYHVFEGAIGSADIADMDGEAVTTLQGTPIELRIEEDKVFVNSAEVVTPDIAASNGVIHAIDTVLMPPAEPAAEAAEEAPAAGSTIVEVVTASAQGDEPEFTMLLAAVQAASPDVLERLSDPNAQLTVFAPTDEAFNALKESLGDEAFQALLDDEGKLTDTLLYHVVNGKVLVADITAAFESEENVDALVAQTLLTGDTLLITKDEEGNYYVNGAQIVTTDIEAANGVIHVIEAVITLPEAE